MLHLAYTHTTPLAHLCNILYIWLCVIILFFSSLYHQKYKYLYIIVTIFFSFMQLLYHHKYKSLYFIVTFFQLHANLRRHSICSSKPTCKFVLFCTMEECFLPETPLTNQTLLSSLFFLKERKKEKCLFNPSIQKTVTWVLKNVRTLIY